MPDTSTSKGVLTNVRRFLSQSFWKLWKSLPVSGKARARVLNFVFSRLPFLVFWSASYRSWADAKRRLRAQLASLEDPRRDPESTQTPPYVELSALPRPDRLLARALAIYLPQASIDPAQVRGPGSRPAELGYYDLQTDPAICRRQAALAHQYGLEGFCFNVSWPGDGIGFDGPLAAYAGDADISFPFCLCWDNTASAPGDEIGFVAHAAAYLKAGKYLRVKGKPLILVRRLDLLANAGGVAELWRDWCRNNGVGEIHIACLLSGASGAEEASGFDSAVDILPGFAPAAYEQDLRRAAIEVAAHVKNPAERLIAIHAWNDWPDGAHLEPDLKQGYARLAATRRALSVAPEVQVEPADLVPAVPMLTRQPARKVLLVIHDLNRNGAQLHTLHLAATFRERFGCEVTTIACADGPLGPEFERLGRLIRLPRGATNAEAAGKVAAQLHREGYRAAFINSSASGWLTPHLSGAGLSCVGLVHELPEIIRQMDIAEDLKAFDTHARRTVFASDMVRRRTETEILGRPWSNPVILPQGHYKADSLLGPDEKPAAAEALRARMGLPEGTVFIVGVGFGDFRKGVDIFCRWAVDAACHNPVWHFVWVGGVGEAERAACEAILAQAGDAAGNVHFAGFQDDTAAYFSAASAYALSSREDPFPTTVLEALACGTPVLFVEGTTGFADIADGICLHALPDAEPATFVEALSGLLSSESRYRAASETGISLIQKSFGFCSFAGDLLRLAGEDVPRVSVVVPNYNYARFLPHRIATILNQELPVWEIIFLDDASTDGSVEVAAQLLKDCGIRYRIVPNTENSGSVFAQWKKGADLAEGDVIWIAEADDWASARFTQVAAAAFADPDVVVSYTQSNQVSQDSEILCPHYLDYVADIDRERWRHPFVNDGPAELNDGFSVKNTIPNVSGALFRREALVTTLAEHMDEICSYRVAGDWCAYAHLTARGKVAFDPRPLNYHRRHAGSVTVSRFTQAEWDEIARMQARVQDLGNVSETMAAKARAYLDALRKQIPGGG